MAFLADEHTPDRPREPAGWEYLCFAVALIAMLLVAGERLELSTRTQDDAAISPVQKIE